MSLFGFGKSGLDVHELLNDGSKVIDVRSMDDFEKDHFDGSINIPLDQLDSRIDDLRGYDKPLIMVCARGIKSGLAVSKLTKKGIACVNAGGWKSLNAD